jgi:hypothetical protein
VFRREDPSSETPAPPYMRKPGDLVDCPTDREGIKRGPTRTIGMPAPPVPVGDDDECDCGHPKHRHWPTPDADGCTCKAWGCKCKWQPSAALRSPSPEPPAPDVGEGLDVALSALRMVADTAVGWEPLTPGDIAEVHKAIALLAALRQPVSPPVPVCPEHGDPLVCVSCEVEEDARPEWQRQPAPDVREGLDVQPLWRVLSLLDLAMMAGPAIPEVDVARKDLRAFVDAAALRQPVSPAPESREALLAAVVDALNDTLYMDTDIGNRLSARDELALGPAFRARLNAALASPAARREHHPECVQARHGFGACYCPDTRAARREEARGITADEATDSLAVKDSDAAMRWPGGER